MRSKNLNRCQIGKCNCGPKPGAPITVPYCGWNLIDKKLNEANQIVKEIDKKNKSKGRI